MHSKNSTFWLNLKITSFCSMMLGCASQPAPQQPLISGEQMLRESQGIASLGDRWKDGKLLVERGNNLVRDGQLKIDEGKQMITEGEKIMRESEENYKSIKK